MTTRLEEEFRNRGWMIVPQPPNSPICNVKNACIFPALSKAVSSIQATIYNNKMLEGDEINTCVQQAWTQLPKTTISRTYLHHHQIVAAIVRDNGGDDFMTEPGGLHCGVRSNSIPIYDEENSSTIGISVNEVLEPNVDEQLQNAARPTWKYPIPNVEGEHILSCLNSSELRFLHNSLPHEYSCGLRLMGIFVQVIKITRIITTIEIKFNLLVEFISKKKILVLLLLQGNRNLVFIRFYSTVVQIIRNLVLTSHKKKLYTRYPALNKLVQLPRPGPHTGTSHR